MKFKIIEIKIIEGTNRLYIEVEFSEDQIIVHYNDFIMTILPSDNAVDTVLTNIENYMARLNIWILDNRSKAIKKMVTLSQPKAELGLLLNTTRAKR